MSWGRAVLGVVAIVGYYVMNVRVCLFGGRAWLYDRICGGSAGLGKLLVGGEVR